MPELPDMTSTGRHGYAVFENGIMIAWIMSSHDAYRFVGLEIINVQNGASFTAQSK